MALDTGRVIDLPLDTGAGRESGPVESYAPTLQSGADIGQALKAAREHQGLTLEAVAEITRIRRAYLAAIEEMRLEELPSRPFTIGYIRAFAKAVDLDGELAVERFKADEPVLDEPLREPIGVHDGGDPRLAMIVAGACVIVAAIVVWNIAQRSINQAAPKPPSAPEAVAEQTFAQAKGGPVSLGAPLPAPVESTTPDLYETPGMAAASNAGKGGFDAVAPGAVKTAAPPPPAAILPASFEARGAVYGAPKGQGSLITLQALKPVSFIVRGPDGSVYFARQLAAGEAYRAPQIAGLVVDVSEPASIQVFAAGQSRGLLPSAQTSVSALAG
ncbi:MAG: helix-turn-helix domain-containing protein [Phenylobacterium sp.]